MIFMQPANLSGILYAKIQLSAICVGKGDHSIHDLAVLQFIFIAFKFMGHVFPKTDIHYHHLFCNIITHACVYVNKVNARVRFESL